MTLLTVKRDGLELDVYGDGPGWAGYWQGVWADGRWEPETYAAIEALNPTVLVDVGAWIGPITLWAAARGIFVHAFEPDPVAAAALRTNVALNGFAFFVAVHQAAITLDGNPTHIAPGSHGGFGESLSVISGEGAEVRSVQLPEFIQAHIAANERVVVKMDVEGYETTLLPTLAPWLAEHGVALNVSFHGAYDDAWFAGFEHTRWDIPGEHGTLTAW